MAIFTLPAGLGIAAIADPLVKVLLGANWLDAIPLIPMLAISGAIASVSNNSGAALVALGAPSMVTALWTARLAFLIPALLIATSAWGIVGAAWAVLAVTAFITPLSFAFIHPRLGIRWRQILSCLWRPVAASAAMYYLVSESIEWLRSHGGHAEFTQLVAAVLTGAISYAVVVAFLWAIVGRPVGAESTIRDWIWSWLRRRFQRGQA